MMNQQSSHCTYIQGTREKRASGDMEEGMMLMSHPVENINKETEII